MDLEKNTKEWDGTFDLDRFEAFQADRYKEFKEVRRQTRLLSFLEGASRLSPQDDIDALIIKRYKEIEDIGNKLVLFYRDIVRLKAIKKIKNPMEKEYHKQKEMKLQFDRYYCETTEDSKEKEK